MAAGALRALLADQPTPDDAAVAAVHARAAEIMRPPGALAWLDDIAAWVAGWQRTTRPRVERPAALVFAADHGIAAAESVSAVAPKVTAAMFAAAERGRGTINAFARIAGATVHAVDVGIAHPTADIRTEAALTPERFDGRRRRRRSPPSTPSTPTCSCSARSASATPRRPRPSRPRSPAARRRRGSAGAPASTTPGSRASDGRCRRRCGASPVSPTRWRCCARSAGRSWWRWPPPLPPPGSARSPSSSTGTWSAPRCSRSCSSRRTALAHCIVGHCSTEPGHRRLLERLGQRPLLDLDMRLGEGSGAMAAVPLVAMACAGVSEVPTYAEWFGGEGADDTR